jgi:CHAT domain-containing protein
MRCIYILLMILIGSGAWVQAQDSTENRAHAQALESFQNGDWKAALPLFRQAEAAYLQQEDWSQLLLTREQLSTCLTRLGRQAEGLQLLRSSLPLAEERLEPQSKALARFNHSLGNSYYRINAFDSAGYFYQKAYAIRLSMQPQDSLLLTHSLINLSMVFRRMGMLDTARSYASRGVQLLQALDKESHPNFGHAQSSLSAIAVEKLDLERAAQHMEQCLENRIQNFGANHPYVALTYYNLALLGVRRKDFQSAQNYYLQTMGMYRQLYGEEDFGVAECLIGLGEIAEQEKRYEASEDFLREALPILRRDSVSYPMSLANAYLILGIVVAETGQPGQAEHFLERAIAIRKQSAGEQDASLAYAYSEMALFLENQGRYPESLEAQEQAIAIFKYLNHPQLATCYSDKGRVLAAQGKLKAGLDWLQNALQYIEPSYPKDRPDVLPNPQAWPNYADLFNVTSTKADLLRQRYQASGKLGDLEQALDHFHFLTQLSDSLRYRFRDDESSYLLSAHLQQAFDKAMGLAMEAYEQGQAPRFAEQAFALSEANRSRRLFEAVKQAQASQFVGVPDSLLQRERKLKVDINFYRQRLFEAPEDSLALQNRLRRELLERQRNYQELIQQLASQYPAYHRLKYAAPPLSLEQAAQACPADMLQIEYFLQDSQLVIFAIRQGGYQLWRQALPAGWRSQLSDLQDQLRNPDVREFFAQPQLSQELAEAAYQWYQWLLAEPISWGGSESGRLVIVPDGPLAYLPFEALLSAPAPSTPNLRDWPFLIKKQAIQYAYSLNLLAEQQQLGGTQAPRFFGGFAPDYQTWQEDSLLAQGPVGQLLRDRNLAPLPGARQEVQQIAAQLDGDAILGAEATAARFLASAGEYRLLHLAMHTLLDDEEPLFSRLLFSPGQQHDGSLTAARLYGLPLRAELAVLSGCNTGYGKILQGEGVLSLSHAFTYAGCPSTLMSLWQVPDQETRELMAIFYKSLQAGKAKDEALRVAKLDYLQGVNAPELAHPFYWAGFVSAGNPAPIRSPWPWPWLLGGLLVLALIAGGLMLRKA